MGEDVRFGFAVAADVEGGLGDVGEFYVDEEAWGGEFGAVNGGDRGSQLVFLAFGEGDAVVYFVVGHPCELVDRWGWWSCRGPGCSRV